MSYTYAQSRQSQQPRATEAEAKFQSPDSEEGFLASAMIDASALVLSAGVGLDHDDFFVPRHRWTFEAITRLHNAGQSIDVATVAATLTEMSRLEDVGGREWLRGLVADMLSASNAESYAITIKRHAIRRAAIRAARLAAEIAVNDDEGDMDTFIERVSQPFANLTRSMASLSKVKTYAQGCDEVEQHLANDEPSGLPTGLADLDKVLHGLKRGKFYIIAARPGAGKTTLAHGAAVNIIQTNNARSLLVSAEMATLEVSMRLLAMEAGISAESIENKTLNDDELERLFAAMDAAKARGSGHGHRLSILDESRVTPEQIRAQALAMKYDGGLDVVFVDYLQLLNSGRDEKNRQAEVAYLSRSMKILARELDIPVVALSQLNREVESRHDKRPMLSDLRDSGALEQDADAVLMLYNDGDYNPDSETPNITEIIIPKNRSGKSRGTVQVLFQKTTPQFRDLDVHTVPLN